MTASSIDDAEDLAAKLESVLTCPDLARRIAGEARRMVEATLSLAPYVDRLEALLVECARRGPKGTVESEEEERRGIRSKARA
jgi:glycosyltransferase involved in cell wall biosynthesis